MLTHISSTFGPLRERAEAIGLRVERRLGNRIAYFARFQAPKH
jgi:hypothetical protein